MPSKLALFDCDGTLVDSQAMICMAMEQAFADVGQTPPPRDEIRRIVGLSVSVAAAYLAPDAAEKEQRLLAERYKQAYLAMRRAGTLEEPLYDGMADLLRTLSSDGWLLGVATGKSERGLKKCLEHHGLTSLFVTLQTSDHHPSKPHPAMALQAMEEAGVEAADTVMIGDTSFDIEMGRAAGCRTVAVAWGYHEIAEMRAAGADHAVTNIAELQACLGEFA